jgi:hypothetical protein
MKMTSVPAPPPLPEPRASPAGTFLKKSMSHSLVFANSCEPSLVSKHRKTTTKNHDPKALKCLEPNGIPPKTKKKKIVRRAHSFDDSNNTPNSPRRASNKKEFLKSQSLPDSKANVTFSHQNSVYEIERVRDVPSITDSDIWWTAKDYLEIKQEYEAVIYLLEQNLPVNELEHSTRGLDKRTERGAWTMFEHQRNARNAVLRQQDIQRKLKYVDETAIAQAYMKECSVLIQQAIQVAAVDEKIACSFLLSNGTSTERSPAAESTDCPVSHICRSVMEVSSPPQTPISTKNLALSPSKMQSPQSPTCWQDSIGFVGCHKAGRSKAAIRDSIVNSYLAAWQQPLNNNELLEDSIASKKSNKSYVSEDNSLVMSDTDSDFNDTTEVDSFSHIDTVDVFDAKQDTTAPHIHDHTSVRVRFAKKVKKIKRIKVKDVEKDTERRWYSKSELVAIAHVVNNVIEMMEKETRLAENDLVMEEKYNETRRGLEKSTETGAWKLFERRREAINSVLVLQSQQRRDNMMNPIALAEGYKAATKEACQEAIKFGKQDAKEAKKYRLKRRSVCDEASSSKKSTQHPAASDELTVRPKSTERSCENSSSLPHSQDSTEEADVCDLSVRSLLDLNEEPSSTPEYNVDNINRIKSRSRRRMSASHPPSRRFVLATAAIFDSTQKSVEHKETSCSPGRIKSKDRNVVMSWRRNSTRSISTDSVATASDTNLLTAMDASVIDDFDVIDHEFTEQSSEGLRRLNAVEAVTDNDVVTKEEFTQENLSIKRQPETVNGRVPDTSKDPLFGLLEDSTPPQLSETAELIQSVEARDDSEKATDVPITCSDKENQPIAGNIDEVAQLESNLDSDAPIWFKVHPSDVRMIKLQDGDVAYLLKNPEKYCLPPSIV